MGKGQGRLRAAPAPEAHSVRGRAARDGGGPAVLPAALLLLRPDHLLHAHLLHMRVRLTDTLLYEPCLLTCCTLMAA